MALVKQYNRKTGTTYVYDSKSYWDPDKKQPRAKRKLIGKLDPDTGEIIPTGKHSSSKEKASSHDVDDLNETASVSVSNTYSRLKEQDATIGQLKDEIRELRKENETLKKEVSRMHGLVNHIISSCSEAIHQE
ncbi:MAG: septum formation initiator family protein [Lachnospiraceae bacterium]|nr:septum formation initiator family protein [Lachnospiraceae bacterium]